MTNTTPPTERVGRYQLLEPIGIGPSGTVSRAKVFGVAGFERQFAVKRFHAELTATAAMAAMLSAAARAYGSLEHPRIARMSEFGVAQGATFTAVEHVVGLDALRLVGEAKLAGNTLAPGGALALVSQAARAVGYAHGRGLTHLGLAPTNVIVTADGDIKISDFGILSATLPSRPIDTARLAQRIPYLAPEQLANEATSAATDVFALGVLAYELVTGARTFKGDTPQAVAAAIMAGPPAEPPLPRPIARVLQRCLARSPFERFPDARALADALDAALRVAPVPGTRKDIGAQVKETLDRLAALNDGQMSGMVALHLGTGPIRRIDDKDLRPAPDPLAMALADDQAFSASSFDSSFDSKGDGPPSITMQDLPRPMTTVPGLAPPPIPVPPGVTVNAPAPSSGLGAPALPSTTLLGVKSPPAIPSIKRPGAAQTPAKPMAIPSITGRASTRDDAIAIEPVGPAAHRAAAHDGAIDALDPDDLLESSQDSGAGIGASLDLDALDDQHDELDAPTSLAPSKSGSGPTTKPLNAIPGPGSGPTKTGSTGSGPATLGSGPSKLGSGPTAKPGSGPTTIGGGPSTGPITKPTVTIPGSGAIAKPLTGPIAKPNGPATGPIAKPNGPATGPIAKPNGPATGPIAKPNGPATGPIANGPGFRDQHSIDTKPIAPVVLDPLLDNPLNRPSLPAITVETPAENESLDDLDASTTATPADPRLGQTILGVGATGPGDLDDDEPLDDISAMALENFRTAQRAAAREATTPLARPAQTPPAGIAASSGPLPTSSGPLPTSAGPLPISSGPLPTSPAPAASGPIRTAVASAPPPAPHLVAAAATQPPITSAPPLPPGWTSTPPLGVPPVVHVPSRSERERRSRAPFIGLFLAAALGVGAWQIYARTRGSTVAPDAESSTHSGSASTLAAGSASGSSVAAGSAVVPAGSAAGSTAGSATVAAGSTAGSTAGSATVAAGSAAGSTAGSATVAAGSAAVATPPPGTGSAAPRTGPPAKITPAPPGAAAADILAITSTPAGARVFLDGADAGVTPVKLAGSPDRHTMALLLANHELYIAQVDGHGSFQIPLKEITPANGPAGIKVLRCKDKDRYYVFLDGKPTGMTCPTERIGCEIGQHTVEVYDVVTETRRKWDVVVKDTRLSLRVRVE